MLELTKTQHSLCAVLRKTMGGLSVKRFLSVLLCLVVMLTSVTGFASGVETSKPITFAGFEFGKTFDEIRSENLIATIDFKYGRYSARFLADALSRVSEEASMRNMGTAYCFTARLKEGSKVGGYDADLTLWFVYPQQDGVLIQNEGEAVFYAGEYSFFSNEQAQYDDLKEKLELVYGEPFFEGAELKNALGDLPNQDAVSGWYSSDIFQYSVTHTVWKSSANNAMVVLKRRLQLYGSFEHRLIYISDCAEETFAYFADLLAPGETTIGVDLEGI